MLASLERIVRSFLPPVILQVSRRLLRSGIYYSGRFDDWDTASKCASGYDSAVIFERVKEATFKVKMGEAAYERDSVTFDEIQHSYPVLAGLLRAGMESRNQLSVLDFGGSLGSSYYQCRDFLRVLSSLSWSIVEQQHFVQCGREMFADEDLQFFFTIAECIEQTNPNAALLSGVLQYTTNPHVILKEIMGSGIQYIVIDRTSFADIERDCVTVQHVPRSIYASSYPCWIFAKAPFLALVRSGFDVLAEFEGADGTAKAGQLDFSFGGMILRKR